jgi:hypothetical protein
MTASAFLLSARYVAYDPYSSVAACYHARVLRAALSLKTLTK